MRTLQLVGLTVLIAFSGCGGRTDLLVASELADEPGSGGVDGGAGKGGSGGGKADAGRDGAGGSSGAAGSGQAGADPGTGGLQACQTCVQDSCSGPGTCLGEPSCVMGITCALTQCLGALGGLGAAGGGMGGFPGGGGLLGGGAAGGGDAGGAGGALQCVTQCFNGNMQAILSVLQSLMCVQSQCADGCQSLLGGLGGLPGGAAGGGLAGGGGFPGGGTGTGGFPGGGTGFAGGAFPGGMMGGTGGGMTGTGQPASQQCLDCVQMSCASEEMACQGAMGCSAIVKCAQDNGCNGMSCLQPCGMIIFQNQGGVQAATAVGQCAQMQCAGSGC